MLKTLLLCTVLSAMCVLPSYATDHTDVAISSAGDYTFELISGELKQGALVYAKTKQGNKVKILKRSVRVDESGHFVFGLGRDIGPNLLIEIIDSKGHSKVISRPVESRTYNVQKIEGVAKKYVSPPESVTARIRKENREIKKARHIQTEDTYFTDAFIWPAKGPVTGVYGSQRVFNGVPKRPHFGLDIAGPTGTPVIAPIRGTVTLAEPDLYYSGGTLIVNHGQGVSSTFIHLSEVLVKTGDFVEQGQLIAKIGATGRVTGPHLDWRMNWFDQRLDPFLLLPAAEESHSP